MKVTFDTKNAEEVLEVVLLLNMMKITLGDKEEVAVKPTETVVEAPKKEKTTPTKAKPKKEVVEAPTKDVKITLADLKDLAKDKVATSDRETVKKIISKYAPKLAEVEEKDYLPLSEDLK